MAAHTLPVKVKSFPLRRGIVSRAAILPFFLLIFAAGCASPGAERGADQLDLRQRVELLERRAATASPTGSQGDIQALRSLEDEIRALKEADAALANELKAMKEAVQGIQKRLADGDAAIRDLSRRIGDIEAKPSGQTGQKEGAAPAAEEEDKAADRPQTKAPGGTGLFGRGRENFAAGRYEMAVADFREFIRNFPESDLADDAQYWIGESYYAAGDLDKAEVEFNRLLTNYSRGDRVPAALLKLGLLLAEKGQLEQARGKLLILINRYPHSDEAPLAEERLVQIELKKEK